MPSPSSSSSRSRVMNSPVLTAKASSCEARPLLASSISFSTLTTSCGVPVTSSVSPAYTVSPSMRILVPSLTRAKISAPTLSRSRIPLDTISCGPEVRVPAGDAGLGVDDRGRLGGDERLGRDPVEVDVVDDRDVAVVEPTGQARGAAVEPGHPADAGQDVGATPQGCELHGSPCCHRIRVWPGYATRSPATASTIFAPGRWGLSRPAPGRSGGAAHRPGRAASASSSLACSRAVALSEPASMRASSATRSSPLTSRTSLAVTAVGPGRRRFVDHDVPVGEGRDLGQVGDDEDLALGGQPGQPAADLDRGPAADAGVDLVEDQRRRRGRSRPGTPRGRASPGRARRRTRRGPAAAPGPRGAAAAASRPRRRRRPRPRPRRRPRRGSASARRGPAGHRHLQRRVGHGQAGQFGRDRAGQRRPPRPERSADTAAASSAAACAASSRRARSAAIGLVGDVDLGQPRAGVLGPAQHAVHAGFGVVAVLAHQRAERGAAGLDAARAAPGRRPARRRRRRSRRPGRRPARRARPAGRSARRVRDRRRVAARPRARRSASSCETSTVSTAMSSPPPSSASWAVRAAWVRASA